MCSVTLARLPEEVAGLVEEIVATMLAVHRGQQVDEQTIVGYCGSFMSLQASWREGEIQRYHGKRIEHQERQASL